jgi:hypothetical protein
MIIHKRIVRVSINPAMGIKDRRRNSRISRRGILFPSSETTHFLKNQHSRITRMMGSM